MNNEIITICYVVARMMNVVDVIVMISGTIIKLTVNIFVSYAAKATTMPSLQFTKGNILNNIEKMRKFENTSSNDFMSVCFTKKQLVDHKGDTFVNQPNDQVKDSKKNTKEGIDNAASSQVIIETYLTSECHNKVV